MHYLKNRNIQILGAIVAFLAFVFGVFYVLSVTGEAAGTMCGGIAGRMCPSGYYCVNTSGNYPDAAGKCWRKLF